MTRVFCPGIGRNFQAEVRGEYKKLVDLVIIHISTMYLLLEIFIFQVMLHLSIATITCPSPPAFVHQVNDNTETFSLDTASLCSNDYEVVESDPICDVRDLNAKMTSAKRHLHDALNQFLNRTPIPRSYCNIDSSDNTISSGQSVANTMKNGIQVMSEILLNATIMNCHNHAQLPTNIQSHVLEVICELRRLCSDLVEPAFYRASLTTEIMGTTDMLFFTCRNLRRSISLIQHLKRDIRFDEENVPAH